MYDTKEAFKKYAVHDVTNISEFLARYYKRDRYTGRGDEYAAILLASHQRDFDAEGWDMISHHDSNTGEVVSFYGPMEIDKNMS